MSIPILVADDSATIRKAISLLLSREDVAITQVDNGLDALRRAQEVRPALIIADCVMPRKSGYEVCAEVKADPEMRGVRVLLLASPSEPFDARKAEAVGADSHMMKPFESGPFLEAVRALASLPDRTATTQAPRAPAQRAAAPAEQPAHQQIVTPVTRAIPASDSGKPLRPPAAPQSGIGARPAAPVTMGGAAARAPRSPIGVAPARAVAAPTVRNSFTPQSHTTHPHLTQTSGQTRHPGSIPGRGMGDETQLREALTRVSRDVLEKVVWEVVPQLAETIIREHVERLIAAKERGES